MARRAEHVAVGAVLPIIAAGIFLGTDFIYQNPIAVVTLIIGSIAPDLIEQSKGNYMHRKLFHSKRALLLALILLVITYSSTPLWITTFFLGYVIHLGMDSRTKMGLPK